MENVGHAIRGRRMHKPITNFHGFRSSTLLKEGIERKERENERKGEEWYRTNSKLLCRESVTGATQGPVLSTQPVVL